MGEKCQWWSVALEYVSRCGPEPVMDLVIDPLTGWLNEMLAGLADGVAACTASGETAEGRMRCVLIGLRCWRRSRRRPLRCRWPNRSDSEQSQVRAQLAADVHPDRIGRGIADQLGLACKVSGFAAARRLGIARALWFDLPDTYRLLVAARSVSMSPPRW